MFIVQSSMGTTGELVSEGMYGLANLVTLYNDHILLGSPRKDKDRTAEVAAYGTATAREPLHASKVSQASAASAQSGGEYAHGAATNGHYEDRSSQKATDCGSTNTMDTFERLPTSRDSCLNLQDIPIGERSIRWVLTALSSVDVVLELAARHGGGENVQRRLILVVEVVKAALKLVLLFKTKKRCIINEGRIEHVDHKRSAQVDAATEPPRWWKGKRTGMRFKVDNEKLRNQSTELEGDCDCVTVSNIRVLGELLHILRPVAYASACQLMGWGSWKALTVSALFDTVSYYCSMYAAWEGGGGMQQQGMLRHVYSLVDALAGRGEYASAWPTISPQANQGVLNYTLEYAAAHTASVFLRVIIWGIGFVNDLLNSDEANHCLTPAEYEELSRRKRLWVLYLLRTPIFQLFTAPVLERTSSSLSYLPLVGMLSRLCKDIVHFHSRVHFHNSGS